MTEQLPPPLVPADVDLRDFAFMPLDIIRLFGSRFHAIATDAEWRAGVTLWAKSFHQVPAGSIPDDDVELCRMAELGRDLKAWKKVREVALHGWVKCSDGRFYHPVVSEKANEAWARKQAQRARSAKGNAARWGSRDRDGDESGGGQGSGKDSQDAGRSMPEASFKDSLKESSKESRKDPKGQGQGQGQGKEKTSGGEPPETPTARKRPAPEALPPWVDADAWAGFEAMRKATRKPLTDAARRLAVSELAKLRDAGQDPTEVLRQSTFRSWAGLFPVKSDDLPRPGGPRVVGAMSEHGLQTMRNAQALERRLFGDVEASDAT